VQAGVVGKSLEGERAIGLPRHFQIAQLESEAAVDDGLRVLAPGLVLDAGVEVLGVLADDDEIDLLVARADARVGLARTEAGVETELVVETSYESCIRDENDVCFVCSLPYVTFERQGHDLAIPVAAPVLMGERSGQQPIYFSDVIVRRDSSIQNFLDFRGRSWAYNEPLSHSGYGITRYHLVKLGETHGFFGEVVEAGFHHEAVAMVARGEVLVLNDNFCVRVTELLSGDDFD